MESSLIRSFRCYDTELLIRDQKLLGFQYIEHIARLSVGDEIAKSVRNFEAA
jgi:hypothetical protein